MYFSFPAGLQHPFAVFGSRLRHRLHVSAPEYLQELCVPVTNSASRHYLRSAARGDLQVLATRTVTYGPHSFAACALKLWNSLSITLRHSTLTLTQLCNRLKTHLFGLAYGSAL